DDGLSAATWPAPRGMLIIRLVLRLKNKLCIIPSQSCACARGPLCDSTLSMREGAARPDPRSLCFDAVKICRLPFDRPSLSPSRKTCGRYRLPPTGCEESTMDKTRQFFCGNDVAIASDGG